MDESLRGTQGQMINLADEQRAEDSRICIGAPPATSSRNILIEPDISRAGVNSEGETTPLD